MRPTITIRLLATMGIALLFAGIVAFVLGFGPDAFSAAQAQTTDQQTTVGESGTTGELTTPPVEPAGASAQQDQPRVESAPGSTQERGVAMRPEVSGQQEVAPEAPPETEAVPLVLTDEEEAAIEQASRGEGSPSGKEILSPPANAPQPEAPALGHTFLGVAASGRIPPDTQIAAGPNNLLLATNGAVNIRSKNGTLLDNPTLDGFFSDLGAAATDVFDPWVAYDPYINRFWILAVSRDVPTQRSTILLGLSDTSDATLGWTLWEFDASINGGLGQPGGEDTQNWCDYPKLGFDAQAIHVTCNMFTFDNAFRYSKVRTMSKTQFVNNTSIRWWDFWNIRQGNAFFCLFDLCDKASTIQPAQMFGASTADGEFLVNAHGGNASTLDVWRITNSAECCNGDATGPTLSHNSRAVKSYSAAPQARQLGSDTRIDTGSTRLLYAFWKGGNLSTGQNMACGSGGALDACVGFTELNLSSYPTISTVNDWAYHSPGVDYYYPAVAVNSAGDKTMVFSRSSSSEFASARYIGIPSSSDCTSCQDGPETVLWNGGNSYVDFGNPPGTRNRWGDYSGASPDPNGTGVWVAGEFADAAANTWGVQAGLTYQTAPPPTNDAFARAQIISGSNPSVSGTTRFATREPSEPDHYTSNPPDSDLWVGDHSVWYRWTAPTSGSTTIDTCTANIDSILAVYTGTALTSLSRVTDNNNGCPSGFGSRVTFNSTAGTIYRIAVGDAGGLRESTFTLNATHTTPDTSDPQIAITTPPQGATYTQGQAVAASYSCTDVGSGVASCQGTVADGANIDTSSTGTKTFTVSAADNAGNTNSVSHTYTVNAQTTAPKVRSTSPANGATGIASSINVTATFSEAMDAVTTDGDPSTINGTTFKLVRLNADGSTTRVTATVTYAAATNKAILNPASNLSSGRTYKATVTTGAQDLAGTALDQDQTPSNGNQPKSWKFKVQ